MLKLAFSGATEEIWEGLTLVCDRLGICSDSEGFPVNVKKRKQGLSLEISSQGGQIGYHTKPEFFRALALLADRLSRKETDASVSEAPRFDTCGAMIDVSRNAVLRVETVKDLIQRMALMGLNMLMLYTEDTYEMEAYPWFGYMRGAYTHEELREMDAYGQIFGVELIPCIQTMGHLKTALRWPYAAGMKDQPAVLLADEPDTYTFIEEMLRTCRNCFSSKRIHIGLDETHGMGLGAYLRKHGYENAYEIMLRHICRVVELAEKYGFRPMMWSDMFFRLGQHQGDYNPLAQIPEDASSRLPQNLEMVYWDYVTTDPGNLECILEKHRQLGRETVFAGGIWTWNRMIVNMEMSFETANFQLAAAKAHGLRTAFVTIWGSGSLSACNIYSTLPGLQMYAEHNYSDSVSMEHLADRFQACAGYSLEDFLTLCIDDFTKEEQALYKDETCCCINSSFQHYYNDVLLGLMDKTLSGYDFRPRYAAYKHKLAVLPHQRDLEWLFEAHRLLADILLDKCDLNPRLMEAYQTGNQEALVGIRKQLSALLTKYEDYHRFYGEIWHKLHKPFGWEALDIELGSIETRIRWAEHRLAQYLSGDISRIEELETERFYFNEIQKPLTETAGARSFLSAAYGM